MSGAGSPKTIKQRRLEAILDRGASGRGRQGRPRDV